MKEQIKDAKEKLAAKEKELNIREKAIQIKEETFEKHEASFQLKMDEWKDQLFFLHMDVDLIKEKKNDIKLRIEEMKKRLGKAEERM